MITLYNTLTRRKDEVRAGHPDGKIRMYACGLTVYSEPHIGNARTRVVFDVLRRWLEFRGHQVVHVENVTDVEDKIIARAAELGVPCETIVGKYDAVRKELYGRLNVLAPAHEPYATAHIPEMISLIERLVAVGLAYESGGDVYFAVRRFPGYGKLSGNSLDDLVAGARVAPGEKPRDPLDFALWKAAKPGEPRWDSPWGPGRPGWHIECSAMASKYLGEAFDIHGGGNDLIFPHHENEIAQSEGATGKPLARIWVHSGWLTLNREKMSKSVGNVRGLREILGRMEAGALRLLMSQTHYRAPFEWSEVQETQGRESYDSLKRLLDPGGAPAAEGGVSADDLEVEAKGRLAAFDEAMDDDLGTPRAVGEVFSLAQVLARARGADPGRVGAVRDAVLARLGTLGVAMDFARESLPGDLAPLLEERAAARKRKDFKRADEIRDLCKGRGWAIEDTPRGQVPRKL